MSFAKMVSPTKKICLQTTTIFVNIVAIVLKIATSMCVCGGGGNVYTAAEHGGTDLLAIHSNLIVINIIITIRHPPPTFI